MDDHTLDIESADLTTTAAQKAEPSLVIALECDRPLALPSRHRLGPAGRVTLGRGQGRESERNGDHRGITLHLAVPDRRMSSTHATLEGTLGQWTVRDAGSRNGVVVNGARVDEAVLRPGDVLQLGHTFLLYEETPVTGDDDLDLASHTPPAAGLETLNGELGESFAKLVQLARARVAILVQGETGTGKEITARAIHTLAGASGRFVGVNCAAIPASLVEGELFGSSKGAYSGSVADRPGLIRDANGGTLFLDEIGDLPLAAQAAFLRVLQERVVRPVGGTQSYPVDLRLVSATNRDAEALVRGGDFRSDLFARIAGFRVVLPPLRARRHDMGLLIARLLTKISKERADAVRFSADAGHALLTYDFPLNVRELENWLVTATALAGADPILPEHFPDRVRLGQDAPASSSRPPANGRPLTSQQTAHRSEVIELLRRHGGNVSAVARETGKARNQVQRWIRRYGIDPDEFR